MDPRIYRACLALIAFAVIVFAFSLEDQPGSVAAPTVSSQYFANAYANMNSLADQYPDRAPGSAGDARLAAAIEHQLAGTSGFTATTSEYSADTADGRRVLEDVVASRPGLVGGQVVVVSSRDSSAAPDPAGLSGTAVMLELAHALSGETLQRTVTVVSTSGSIGAAGASHLASELSDQPVEALVFLGNLVGPTVRQPVVVPWSDSDLLSPLMLRNTLKHYLSADAGIATQVGGIGGQFARLAFPIAVTQQAPLVGAGLPAALVSLSGDRLPPANLPTAPVGRSDQASNRLAGIGTALLQAVNAFDQGPSVGAPRPYMILSGKLVPAWAVRLLVLALMAPVLAATIDAVARARRRGHSILRWVAWVLAAAAPFVAGMIVVLIAAAAGVLHATPPGAVAGGAVTAGVAGVATVVVSLIVIGFAFVYLRPLCLKAAARLAGSQRRPQSPPVDAAAVALSVVMSVTAVVLWFTNPFAAALLVLPLHLWLWLASPGLRTRRWFVIPLLVISVIPAVALCAFYCLALGTSPLGLAWTLTLMVAGGAMPPLLALIWCVTLGCLSSATVISARSVRSGTAIAEAPVTVRGPTTYAGPGSLGGTESALRR